MNSKELILKNIPKSPGVYKYFNKDGKIIYIGKSVNLFSRVNSYFNGKSKLNFAKKKMVSEIDNIETIVVNNEKESLILETTLIKKHKPKYNILMKDDKNHLYISITNEEIPKIIKTRIKNSYSTLFGPYISSNQVNNILKIIKKLFGYRSCQIDFIKEKDNIIIKKVGNTKIPCIDYYTKRCSGPCLLGEKEISEYKNSINSIKDFLNGKYKDVIKNLEIKMKKKAEELKFEEALDVKNDIESIKSLDETQIVRDFVMGNYEVINYIEKYDSFFIGIVSIVDSKVVDFRNYEIETHLEETLEEIIEEFIEREIDCDKKTTILLPIELNSQLKDRSIEVPKIGDKSEILKLAYKNVYNFAYNKHLSSLSTKSFTKQTMKNLLDLLGYKEINKDILFECNDISHLSGSHTVASRSIIENGKPNNSKYKKFNIKTLESLKIDDFSSMKEIMERRLKELLNIKNIPDLIIIDGGKGQLSSVIKIIEDFKLLCENQEELNLINSLQLVSIAKKEEELFLPGESLPILLSKDSQELRIIQKIRDEAHRFAITFNREKRLKSEKKNLLESIPGIGPKTRAKLTKTYGNIDNLKGVSLNELKKILSKNQIESLESHGII